MKILLYVFDKEKLFYIILFAGCALTFLAHYFIAGQAVYGDGIGYYSYLHSLYFDRDVDFRNELVHVYDYEHNNAYDQIKSDVGKISVKDKNTHTIGASLMLMPFYILADLVVIFLNSAGVYVVRNGYSDIYQIFTGIGSIVYLMIGFKITQGLICNILLSNNIKNISTAFVRFVILTIFLSSPLIYYGAVDTVNSHAVSFFIVSVFFTFLFRESKNLIKKYLFLSFLIGIATMVRLQEVLLFLPFFCKFIEELNQLEVSREKTGFVRQLLLYIFLSGLVFLISILPMLLSWKYVYGNIFKQDYASPLYNIDLRSFTLMNYFGSLIDSANGLFARTPLLLILFCLMPFAFKNFRKEAYIFLSYFIMQFFIIMFYHGWGAAAYGGRMYITSLLLFILFGTKLFDSLRKKYSYVTVVSISAFFILLNIVNIFSFMVFEKENTSNSRGIEKATKVRIEKIINEIKSL